MKLNVLHNLRAVPTGRAMPPRHELMRLGLYQDSFAEVDKTLGDMRTVFRMELRVGTQFAVDAANMRRDGHLAHVEKSMRGRVAEHIFGGIHAELRQHLHEMMDEGITGAPVDRVNAMLSKLERAFRGEEITP